MKVYIDNGKIKKIKIKLKYIFLFAIMKFLTRERFYDMNSQTKLVDRLTT